MLGFLSQLSQPNYGDRQSLPASLASQEIGVWIDPVGHWRLRLELIDYVLSSIDELFYGQIAR
jgi:hypothetical protein